MVFLMFICVLIYFILLVKTFRWQNYPNRRYYRLYSVLGQTILIVWKHPDFLCVLFIFNLQFCFNDPNIIGSSKFTSILFFLNSSRRIMLSNRPVGINIRKTNYPFVMDAFQLFSLYFLNMTLN